MPVVKIRALRARDILLDETKTRNVEGRPVNCRARVGELFCHFVFAEKHKIS